MKMYVMQGPPASGKSTKAKEIYARDPEHTVIVSRDALRKARGDYWIPQQEKFITALEDAMIRQAFEFGYDVVLDATNLNPSFINKFKALAAVFHAEIEFIPCFTPLEICIVQDSPFQPNREHHVGEKVIKQFFEKYNIDPDTGRFNTEV